MFAGWAGNIKHSEHFRHLSFDEASGSSACASASKPKIRSQFSIRFSICYSMKAISRSVKTTKVRVPTQEIQTALKLKLCLLNCQVARGMGQRMTLPSQTEGTRETWTHSMGSSLFASDSNLPECSLFLSVKHATSKLYHTNGRITV